jgi:hypothetical protein
VLVGLDPAEAFEVFTADVDLWWRRGPAFRVPGGDAGELRFEPGVGGRLVQGLAEGREWELGRVSVWDPGRRLVFEFRVPNFEPDQTTEVEVVFESSDGGTRVTVEHRGWAGLPRGHPARHGLEGEAFLSMRGRWWIELLRALRSRAR